MKLINVSEAKTAEALARHILGVLKDLKVQLLVAQAYDGASVMASGLNGVQRRVRDRHPLANFIHCHAHELNLVISQGMQAIAACRGSFMTIQGMANLL